MSEITDETVCANCGHAFKYHHGHHDNGIGGDGSWVDTGCELCNFIESCDGFEPEDKMRITNRNNLPAPLVSAVSNQRRPRADAISVTELIGPPQIRQLQLEHWDELEEDASDRMWATMGTLMHKLLEGHAGDGHLSERTLSTWVEEDYIVTGTFDLLRDEDGTLFDYKFVSVWTTMDGIKPEWEQQLNCYAELLRREGVAVSALRVVAIYRDWTKSKSFEHGYPGSQVAVFEVPLWTCETASQFLAERVRLHVAAEEGKAVACTPEERWARPTRYALMRRGRTKAIKLYDDPEAARVEACMPDLYVQERPGASVRCESYCRVSAFCSQFAAMKATAEETQA